MDPDLAGFIGLAALMVTLVAWLRIDMNGRMDRLETAQGERLTRIEATQAEHGAALSEHGAMLSAHGAMLSAHGATLSEQGERLARIEATQAEQGERLTRIEATLAEHGATLSAHGERLIRIEAAQNELRERMDGLDAELRAEMHAARADLSRINERMARTEGTVAGALGRPFPELTTRPADATAAAAAAE